MKRSLLLFIFITGFLAFSYGIDTIPGKIVFYRPHNFRGAGITYKIFVNNQKVSYLPDQSLFEYECSTGEYVITVNRLSKSRQNLMVVPGKTHYLRFNRRYSIPKFESTDSIYANLEIINGKYRVLNEPWSRSKRTLGINMIAGGGFEIHPMFISSNGDTSSISFGGGIGFQVKYGYEIDKFIEFSMEYNHQTENLSYPVADANIKFVKNTVSVTPLFILGRYNTRFKIGGGMDFCVKPKLIIRTSGINGGVDDDWLYKNSTGAHLSASMESTVKKWLSLNLGFKIYKIKYDFDTSKKYFTYDKGLNHPDGSGLDVNIGLHFHF